MILHGTASVEHGIWLPSGVNHKADLFQVLPDDGFAEAGVIVVGHAV